MASPSTSYYALSPGVDAVPLGEEELLFRGGGLLVRLEGAFARLLQENLLVRLTGRSTLADIADDAAIGRVDELQDRLDRLVEAQVLQRSEAPAAPAAETDAFTPLYAFAERLGLPPEDVARRLEQVRVAVFGLEGPGAHAASLLARSGVGDLLCVDPFPLVPGDILLSGALGPDQVGTARASALASELEAARPPGTVRAWAGESLTRSVVHELAQDRHLLVVTFDRGFASAAHWVNQAALEAGIPALFAEGDGHRVTAGPLVIPGETACYTCYRMRSVAVEEDFEGAMRYEEVLDAQKRPRLAERPAFPTATAFLGSYLANEALKLLLGVGSSPLTDGIATFDVLDGRLTRHPVLRRPDCPACSPKKKALGDSLPDGASRWSPPYDALVRGGGAAQGWETSSPSPRPLGERMPELVSARTGVILSVAQVTKDVSEPTRPFVYRALLANSRFVEQDDRTDTFASGKGATHEEAVTSALGEAVERYSGGCWDAAEVVYATAEALDGPRMDPADLVLYRPEQYGSLPYAPYSADTTIGWIRARSLVSGDAVYVPALGVFMEYEVTRPGEFLCPITSNGLAAGPSLLEAVYGAITEVLERDAFLLAWLHRLPGRRLDLFDHPDPVVRAFHQASARRGVDVRVFDLPIDHPCYVCAAVAFEIEGPSTARLRGPAAVVGLGADISLTRAARQAALEVGQVRPGLRRRLRLPETQQRLQELVDDPSYVETLDDHALLYAHPASLDAFDFLLDLEPVAVAWDPPVPPRIRLRRLVNHFRKRQQDLLYCDLTPPDMAALGVYTARALVPGFQPIHFGRSERRLGGHRLFKFPQAIGRADAPAKPQTLNDAPHPLA